MLEVCIGSLGDAKTAVNAGAQRLEICGALELGGLTPSLGLVEQVIAAVDVPAVVMIRPRGGGFCYSDLEFRCMLRDAELALEAGARGIVFGCLTETGTIAVSKVTELVAVAGNNDTVFHRAFDFVPDLPAALHGLINIGVKRVLTSGGATTAIEGAQVLKLLIEQAKGHIELLPGGGVTASHVEDLIRITGCDQVHAGAATSAIDVSVAPKETASLYDLERLSAGEQRVVDFRAVAELATALSIDG